MSKRPNAESQEERWLRKMKMYEGKIVAKRRRIAERDHRRQVKVLGEQQQNELCVPRDAQNGEHSECEGIPRPDEPDDANRETDSIHYYEMTQGQGDAEFTDDTRHDVAFEDESMMTETTACTSPNSLCEINMEKVVEIDDFDPDLLRVLGNFEPEPAEFGEDLQADVAVRFQKILQEGIKKDIKEELLKKYSFPKNVTLAKSPTLNPEIEAMLTETCKLRDKRLLAKQDQLGKTLSALGKALTDLLKKSPDIPEVIRTLNDASMLLADSHYLETDTRRSVIIPLIDKSLSNPFKDRKRDSFLFGDKLGDLVKDSRGIKKTGQLIQPSTSSGSNLNARGPSSRGARQQRGSQAYLHRAGGPRTATMPAPYPYSYMHLYQNRRRAPAQLPTAGPRKYPAPPPPPAARRQPLPAQRPATNRQA